MLNTRAAAAAAAAQRPVVACSPTSRLGSPGSRASTPSSAAATTTTTTIALMRATSQGRTGPLYPQASSNHSAAETGDDEQQQQQQQLLQQRWQDNLVTQPDRALRIAAAAAAGGSVVAVLGIKTERQAGQPAFTVPRYLQSVGAKVIPVPVFYPEVTEILGEPVYRKVSDVPVAIDILNVFRKPSDIPPHLDDILAAHPKVVWLQQGISHPESEEVLARAGIQVVSNRCIMVDHMRAVAGGSATSHL